MADLLNRARFLRLSLGLSLAPLGADSLFPDGAAYTADSLDSPMKRHDDSPAGLPAHGAAVHPRVNMTPDDIAQARRRVTRHAWARAEQDAIVKAAAESLARSDDWYRQNTPAPGACFAYGFTGCPICGASCGTWWTVRADWSAPGKVTCANGHVLPDEKHPDSGTGYIAPDGRIHYLVGSYNAWVIENLTFRAANLMAYAYVLTGDENYAARAAHVLDLIASIYPACTKGSWDYPSNPPSGRLDRPFYQVARVLVHYTDQYDLLYHSPALDTASVVSGLTRRQNIERNLLRNGAAYCHEEAARDTAMNNGCADYLRGAMAVGICLDIPEYLPPAIDGPTGIRAMLDNNIDRDGAYYETSTLYAHHTRALYTTFAEPLYHLRTAAYPEGVDLYRNGRYRAFNLLHDLSQKCLGMTPCYGDTGLEVAPTREPDHPADADDYFCVERLFARTRDQKEKREYGRLLNYLAGGNVDHMRMKAGSLDRIVGGGLSDRCWLLFHAGDAPAATADAALAPEYTRRLSESHFLGQKGIGILRRAGGHRNHAALVRFGPSLNHGHLDDLNLNYFALGHELTYDLGYGLGSTHTQVGWSHQTASHNLVLVDECSQEGGPGRTGGSLHLFADAAEEGAPQMLEASSEESYAAQNVSTYRRTVALLDGCLVDIFRVRGGAQHDYLFHARSADADFEGVRLGAERPGSLAGAEYDWGDRQLNDGDIAGHPNKPYWNPPPGNGLGFLTHVRSGGAANGPFAADWRIDPKTRLRVTFLPEPETEVLTAVAPGIVPQAPKARYVIARRKRQSGGGGKEHASCFVTVAEPYEGEAARRRVASVERLPLRAVSPAATAADTPELLAPVAIRIRRAENGGSDIVYSSGDDAARHLGEGIEAAGRFVHAAYHGDGSLERLTLLGGNRWAGNGWEVTAPRSVWGGSVTAIDYDHSILTLDTALPEGEHLADRVVYFHSPRGGRTTAYRIRSVERGASVGTVRLHVQGDLLLGRGQVGEVRDAKTLTSRITHEYSLSLRRPGETGFFQEKQICGVESGATARIHGALHGPPMVLTVDDASGFRPDERFTYRDIAVGDRFLIHGTISLVREPGAGKDGRPNYRLTSDLPARAIRRT